MRVLFAAQARAMFLVLRAAECEGRILVGNLASFTGSWRSFNEVFALRSLSGQETDSIDTVAKVSGPRGSGLRVPPMEAGGGSDDKGVGS